MAGQTVHYNLITLDRGESFSLNGQQYTTTDRDTIDRLLYAGAQGHHHNAATITHADPDTVLDMSLNTVGTLPASSRFFYVYTWVDSGGYETAPSDEVFIDTAPAVATPGAATAVPSATGGTLVGLSGYYYVLSAFTTTSSAETVGGSSVYVVTPAGSTSSITLTYPTLPSGATGFNIYRRAPGETGYFFLASVDSPPSTYVDTGATSEIFRSPSGHNATNSTNSVTLTAPAVPGGFTWNLYRGTTSGSWALLTKVIDTGSGVPTTYVDVGNATRIARPPTASQLISAPSKINLATETTGILPVAQGLFPVVVTFEFPSFLAAQAGKDVWVCPFGSAFVQSVRLTLGRGSHPASTPVIVDVLKGTGATPTYASIFAAATPSYPRVVVGSQTGLPVLPTVSGLVSGDSLSPDILQSGGGATPTDHDLTICVLLLVTGEGLVGL